MHLFSFLFLNEIMTDKKILNDTKKRKLQIIKNMNLFFIADFFINHTQFLKNTKTGESLMESLKWV